MAQKQTSKGPTTTNTVLLGKNDHVKTVLTKIHRIFVDHSSNNKIPKHRHSHTSNQDLRINRTYEPVPPTQVTPSTRNVEKAFAIFKSDTFTCIYNVNKNIRESGLTNGGSNINFDFLYNGDVVVLQGTPLYPCLDKETHRPSPSITHVPNTNEGQNSQSNSLNGECNDNQTQYQDPSMQSKRISITFGQNPEPVGISIKRLDLSEGSGIYVIGIQPNSPAARDGRLKVFDELLTVNDTPVRQFPYDQLRSIFTHRGITLKLTVYRNCSAAILHAIGYPIPNDNTGENFNTYHSPSNSDPSIEYVELHSDMRDFGFFVAPGCGEYPVINHISPASQSELDNRLRIGDELIQVNEHHVRNVASQVVMELIQKNTDIKLKVRHMVDPLKTPTEMHPQVNHTRDVDIISVTIMRDTRGSLGISIQGVTSDNDVSSPEDGIYIAKISTDGPADMNGIIKEGDRIIEVNGNNLKGVDLKRALRLVKMSGNPVNLVLERGRDGKQVELAYDQDSSTENYTQENTFTIPSVVSDVEVSQREESNKSNSIHSGVSSIHGFYPSRLSEASLQFSHDPQGILDKEEKTRLVKEWQPRVGPEKIVKIAQLTKYSADGEIGLEIEPKPVYQKNELTGMKTVISAISSGPAKDDGVLLQGDEILEINGVRVTDVHYDDVIALLKATPQQIRLVVAGPHERGEVPTHYLMSSLSSSEGESPSNTLEMPQRKKSYKSNKFRDAANSSTYPRQQISRLHEIIQTDLDETDDLLLLKEIHEQNRKEQLEELEQMKIEKEKLEREVFSKSELDNEAKLNLRACLDRVQLHYEKETTLPRPSKYSKMFSYKHPNLNSFGQTSTSYVASGIATTPRAPKAPNNPKFFMLDDMENTTKPLPITYNQDSLKTDKSKVAELGLEPNEANLLNLVCVPFNKHESNKKNQPLALIPFPIMSHSATTSDDESIQSPTKLSFPETPILPSIEQEAEHVFNSRIENERQEITVTKGETLGIGIDRQRVPETKGKKYKIVIHDIVAGSAPAKDGRLKIGDELLSINSFNVEGKSKQEVALHITNLPKGPVVLTVLHQQQDTLTKENKHEFLKKGQTPLRTFKLISPEKTNLNKIEKAFSLSTISDGSKIDFLGSRITHSSSNSNNSLNDHIDPYPLKMLSNIHGVDKLHKIWDDFNIDSLELEDGNRLFKSKSLDLETRDESSSNSLDELHTTFLDQDISVFPQPSEELNNNNTLQMKSNHNSTHGQATEQISYSYENSPPILPQQHPQQHQQQYYQSAGNGKRQSVPRGVVREVHLSRKRDANLGISIVEKFIPGVLEQSKGIFIKLITDPIVLSGQLEQDDQVLEVNGIDMNGFLHDQAVNLIKKASEPVILKLLHSPEFVKRISLAKIASEHSELGGEIIHSYFVTGNKGSGIVVETARQINERVGRTYFKVSEVIKRSSAEESKNIMKDDVIININGLNAVGINHQQLVKLLNTPHCDVSIILCRTTNKSPRELNNDRHPPSRARLYLKSCLIDKVHEVEICVEAQESAHQRPIIVITGVKSKHPSFLEEIHPGDELVAINKKNLNGWKVENVQRWLYELQLTSQYEISFYSRAPHSTSTSTGSAHSYELEQTRPPSYTHQLSAQFTCVFYKEARQDVGLLFVDGEVDGVYIEEVDPNGLAATDQRVRPGCRVVAINDRNLMNDEASFVEMVLNGVIGQISLTLESSFVHRVPHQHAHGYFTYSSESSQDMSTTHSPQPHRSMPEHNIPPQYQNMQPQYHNIPPQMHNLSPQVNLPPPVHDMSDYFPKRGTRIVQLFREGEKGFGLTLRGGANTSHGDLPLFVGKVYQHQAAHRSGQVHERDVILAINDIPTLGMTCIEAVAVLKAYKVITLTLSDEKDPIADILLPQQRNSGMYNDLMSSKESLKSRDAYISNNNSNPERKYAYNPYSPGHTPPMRYNTNVLVPTYPANMYTDWNSHYISPHVMQPNEKINEPPPYEVSQNYILKQEANLLMVHLQNVMQRGFGFSISGGVDNLSGPQPILIKSMTDDGAAKLDGNFAVGDEICAVNGHSLINVTHHHAVNILKQCQEQLKPEQEVQLLIRKRQV
ncbi:MPDZ [Oopsacas minuta]|uniref:MPDZ n=1 Tax=Oopsacas minuta TaxID=111878 RepID=A0A2P1GIX6_9METZ|nr:MPDZ [Oopsacas minuta]KAI6653640.1 MPDZ [Oopsacas minuta]